MCDAVRMGIGAARLSLSLVSSDRAAGTLVRWGDVQGPEIALWALYPTRRLLSARVSACLDYLREAFPMGTPDELAAYVAGSATAKNAKAHDFPRTPSKGRAARSSPDGGRRGSK